jgi:hypothetical protein
MPAELKWELQPQKGDQPTPRSGHSMNFVGRGTYLMYGGIAMPKAGEKVEANCDLYTLKMAR